MDDKTAVKWLKEIERKYIHGGDDTFDYLRKEAINLATNKLSAQKKGHWIERHYIGKNPREMMVCSNCRTEWSYDAETGVSDYNFCPTCGADMREEDNQCED